MSHSHSWLPPTLVPTWLLGAGAGAELCSGCGAYRLPDGTIQAADEESRAWVDGRTYLLLGLADRLVRVAVRLRHAVERSEPTTGTVHELRELTEALGAVLLTGPAQARGSRLTRPKG
jgi:hypothetical protein